MPNLTSKELTALEDQIGHEETLIKKYEAMSALCNDQRISQSFTNYAEKHRRHYSTLITFLQ